MPRAVSAGTSGSRLPTRNVSTHQTSPPAANCSRHSFGKKVRSRRNSVSRPIEACDSRVRASAGNSSLRSIQIASGIPLIHVYNLMIHYDRIERCCDLQRHFWTSRSGASRRRSCPRRYFCCVWSPPPSPLLEVLGALLPPSSSDADSHARRCLSVGLPLLFAWVVLAVARQRQRFLQTGTALLGVAVLAQLVLYPLGSLLNIIGTDRPASIPLGVLLFVGLDLVLARLREHLARRARFAARAGRGDQRRLPVAVDGLGTAAAAGSLDACTCTSWESPGPSWEAWRRSPRRRDFASPARISTSIRR